MKVALLSHSVFPTFIGGRELFLRDLSKYMKRNGIDTEIFAGDAILHKTTTYESCPVHRYPMKTFHLFGYPYRIVDPRMLVDLHRFQPDVIHCLDYRHFTTDLGTLYGSLFHIPVLLSIHGLGHIATPLFQKLLKLYDATIGKLTLRSVSKIVAYPFPQGVEPFFSKYQSKIMLIDPAIDMELLQESQENHLREQYHLEKKFVVLCIGRDTQGDYKGHEFLKRNWPKIKPPNSVLVIVGHEQSETLEDILILKKVSQEDLFQFYQIADLFVLPSKYETCGKVVLESLCYGLPVVGNPVGIMPYVLNGSNGSVTRFNHVEDYEHLFAYYAKYGHKFDHTPYRKQFDWNRIIQEFIKVYEEVLCH